MQWRKISTGWIENNSTDRAKRHGGEPGQNDNYHHRLSDVWKWKEHHYRTFCVNRRTQVTKVNLINTSFTTISSIIRCTVRSLVFKYWSQIVVLSLKSSHYKSHPWRSCLIFVSHEWPSSSVALLVLTCSLSVDCNRVYSIIMEATLISLWYVTQGCAIAYFVVSAVIVWKVSYRRL